MWEGFQRLSQTIISSMDGASSYLETSDIGQFVWDGISTGAIGLAGYPFVALCLQGDPRFAWFAGGVVAIQAICAGLKGITKEHFPNIEMFKRPMDALNCSAVNAGGFVGGNPGMPSGHVAATAFVLAYSWWALLSKSVPPMLYLIMSALAVALVAASRVAKKCHTVTQTIAGAVLGIALAYVWSRYVHK